MATYNIMPISLKVRDVRIQDPDNPTQYLLTDSAIMRVKAILDEQDASGWELTEVLRWEEEEVDTEMTRITATFLFMNFDDDRHPTPEQD